MTTNTNAAPDLRDQIMDVITGVWDRETQIGDAADTVIDLCALSAAAQPPADEQAAFDRYWLDRQRARGFGAALSDDEMLRNPERRKDELHAWQTRAMLAAATKAEPVQPDPLARIKELERERDHALMAAEAEAREVDRLRALNADDLREPKSGTNWRVEWWNESARLMLPANKSLYNFQSFANGSLIFTIKEHGIQPAQQPAPREPLRFGQRQALAICTESQKVSVSEVQRKMKISYAAAQELCQSLVDYGGLVDGFALSPSLKPAHKEQPDD